MQVEKKKHVLKLNRVCKARKRKVKDAFKAEDEYY